jgi:YD repeat-containing protein
MRLLLALLIACALLLGGLMLVSWRSRQTERLDVVRAAIARMSGNADMVQFLGTPITAEAEVLGDIRHDETGWREARLMIPVRGPKGEAQVHVIGGSGTKEWMFTTFDVVLAKEHKKVDLISGKTVEYDPNAYVNVHTQAPLSPVYSNGYVPEARSDGNFPCVFVADESNIAPSFGQCPMPLVHTGAVHQFEVDLRDGNFVLQETDLRINDVFDVPLTRSYRSNDWTHSNPVHAFGRNSSHPYDICPLGTRNPYTYQMLILEDGEFLYFDRISKGTGYADAVYQHTETSTRFYKATQSWNGNGWTMRLADGSEIVFPESYNAKNMAQGAPTEMRDAKGNRLELKRDPQRNLQEIRTPHGHWIRFTYDELSRIKRAEDDAGNWTQYEYNSGDMLITVSSSAGWQRHYEYEGRLMTQISDEQRRVLVRNWYEPGLVRWQQFGNGEVYSYDYYWPSGNTYPGKVVVTLPDHTTRVLSVAGYVPEFVRNYHKQ